jgi:AcrR family transcriptional regulator
VSERHEQHVRARPPRVQLDIDQIVDAAMAIADRDGPDAMTMRAIGKELGVGAMSLYWYVSNKRDLEALVLERLMRDSAPPETVADDWRANLTAMAMSARQNMLSHPWMVDLFSSTAYMTPDNFGHGFLVHVENSMRMVEDLPLDFATKMVIIGTIDDFTMGFTFGEVTERRRLAQLGMSEEELHDQLGPRLFQLLEEHDYPLMRHFIQHDHELPDKETQFRMGLNIILGGVSQMLADAGEKTKPDGARRD